MRILFTFFLVFYAYGSAFSQVQHTAGKCTAKEKVYRSNYLNIFRLPAFEGTNDRKKSIELVVCRDTVRTIRTKKEGLNKEWNVQYKDSIVLLTASQVDLTNTRLMDSTLIMGSNVIHKSVSYAGEQIQGQTVTFISYSQSKCELIRLRSGTYIPIDTFHINRYWVNGQREKLFDFEQAFPFFEHRMLDQDYPNRDMRNEIIWIIF